MTRIRYTMPAKSQGKLYTQRQQARHVEKDVHRWLTTRLDAMKALIKATGLSPHLSVFGWPFCLVDLDGVDDMKGGAM